MRNACGDPVDCVLKALRGRGMKVRPGGESQWQAFCPVHEADGQGHKPSLSVGTGDDGRVLIHCHAGCPTESVLAALGLKPADLMPSKRRKPPARKNQRKVLGPIVKTYDYLDARGKLLFQVTRHDDPKTFRQRRPDGNGGWIPNLNGTPRVLYKLQELLAAEPDEWVFVVEGEKDVESLASIGLQATCNPGGAGKWNQLDNDSALHGRHVIILPDKDVPGRRHAQDVASRLRGKAAMLKVLELPKRGHQEPSGKALPSRGAALLRPAAHRHLFRLPPRQPIPEIGLRPSRPELLRLLPPPETRRVPG